jgi:hypothetical protein
MRRIVLALVLTASASPALAVQDRYGPPRTESAADIRAAAFPAGPLLDWTGKAAPQAVAAPAAPPRPAPMAPWAQRLAPQPPSQAAPQPQARLLPPSADRPQPFAQRAAPAAPPPVRTAMAPNATERPRVYSVGRQYGEQPDPIPLAVAPRGQPMTLSEIPTGANLTQNQPSSDDIRGDRDMPEPRPDYRIPRYAP